MLENFTEKRAHFNKNKEKYQKNVPAAILLLIRSFLTSGEIAF